MFHTKPRGQTTGEKFENASTYTYIQGVEGLKGFSKFLANAFAKIFSKFFRESPSKSNFSSADGFLSRFRTRPSRSVRDGAVGRPKYAQIPLFSIST